MQTKKREKKREPNCENNKIIEYTATVTVYIYMVIVYVQIYTVLEGLM